MLTLLPPSVFVLASILGKISVMLLLVRLLGNRVKRKVILATARCLGYRGNLQWGVFFSQCTLAENSWKSEVYVASAMLFVILVGWYKLKYFLTTQHRLRTRSKRLFKEQR